MSPSKKEPCRERATEPEGFLSRGEGGTEQDRAALLFTLAS